MANDWDDFLELLTAVQDDLGRDIDSFGESINAMDWRFPRVSESIIDSARSSPKMGISRQHVLAYREGNRSVQFVFRARTNTRGEVVAQIVTIFTAGDDRNKSAMRFETPSCYEFDASQSDGEHDFYHIQFCQSLRDKTETSFSLPLGFEDSWPTIPLGIESSCELLWTALLAVFGRKNIKRRYNLAKLGGLSDSARQNIQKTLG